MSAKVVLPNFHLPGQGPHIAVRALWAAGGLVVVSTLILGGALWHRQTVDTAAQLAAARALVAAAQPAVAAPAPAAPAVVTVAAAAPAAEQAAAAPAPAPANKAASARSHARHRAVGARRASHSMKGRTLARGGAADRSSKKPAEKKDDTIDRLLRQFK